MLDEQHSYIPLSICSTYIRTGGKHLFRFTHTSRRPQPNRPHKFQNTFTTHILLKNRVNMSQAFFMDITRIFSTTYNNIHPPTLTDQQSPIIIVIQSFATTPNAKYSLTLYTYGTLVYRRKEDVISIPHRQNISSQADTKRSSLCKISTCLNDMQITVTWNAEPLTDFCIIIF